MSERNMEYKSKSSIPEEAKVKKGLCNCEVFSFIAGEGRQRIYPIICHKSKMLDTGQSLLSSC